MLRYQNISMYIYMTLFTLGLTVSGQRGCIEVAYRSTFSIPWSDPQQLHTYMYEQSVRYWTISQNVSQSMWIS